MNSYDFWHNNTKTILIHLISDIMMPKQYEFIWFLTWRYKILLNSYCFWHNDEANMNSYDFWHIDAEAMWIHFILDKIIKNNMDSYHVWHNDAKTIWIRMISDRMVQRRYESLWFLTWRFKNNMVSYDFWQWCKAILNSYDFWHTDDETIWIHMISDKMIKHNLNSYDFWHNDAKTIWIHMISDRMMQKTIRSQSISGKTGQKQYEFIWFLT